MNFKLYAYIYDLNKGIGTRTDLRIGILEAFKAAGIVIPSRQTEVTVREMEWLREAVNHYIAKPKNGHAPGNGGHPLAAASEKSDEV